MYTHAIVAPAQLCNLQIALSAAAGRELNAAFKLPETIKNDIKRITIKEDAIIIR